MGAGSTVPVQPGSSSCRKAQASLATHRVSARLGNRDLRNQGAPQLQASCLLLEGAEWKFLLCSECLLILENVSRITEILIFKLVCLVYLTSHWHLKEHAFSWNLCLWFVVLLRFSKPGTVIFWPSIVHLFNYHQLLWLKNKTSNHPDF